MKDRTDGVRRGEVDPKVGDETDSILQEIMGIIEEVLPDGLTKVRFKGSNSAFVKPGDVVKTWCPLKFHSVPHFNGSSIRVEMLPYRE